MLQIKRNLKILTMKVGGHHTSEDRIHLLRGKINRQKKAQMYSPTPA